MGVYNYRDYWNETKPPKSTCFLKPTTATTAGHFDRISN